MTSSSRLTESNESETDGILFFAGSYLVSRDANNVKPRCEIIAPI